MKALLSFLLLLCLRATLQQRLCDIQGCGNGICEPSSPLGAENCDNCPFDCGLCPKCDGVCGNQLCETAALENACNCPEDCGICCQDGWCSGEENAANCPSDCVAALNGQVYDVDTFVSLANATVVCRTPSLVRDLPNGITTTSSSDGGFVFNALSKNIYTCTATLGGYLPGTSSVNFVAHTHISYNTTIRIGLKKLTGLLVGGVFDNSTKSGIRGANVSCTSQFGHEVNRFTLDGGSYYFRDILVGFHTCVGSAPGYFSTSANITITAGLTTKQDFYLRPRPASFSGKVIDKGTGGAIRNAQIVCKALSYSYTLNATSDTAGGFSFVNVDATEYRCESTVYGYTRGAATICLMHGESGSIILYMSKIPSVLTGTVRDAETNATIPNALVRCASADALIQTSTNDVGVYLNLGVLPSAGLVCEVSAATYFTVREIVEVPPATTVVKNYLLSPKPGNVSGVVRDSESLTPLANFTVVCYNSRLRTSYTINTDARGNYQLLSIPAGPLECTASGPRFNSLVKTSTLGRDEAITINFDLVPLKGALVVSVRDSVTLIGLASAQVVCTNDFSTATLVLTTGVNGTASAGLVRIGFYTCQASYPRYLTTDAKSGTVVPNATLSLDFLLAPSPGSLLGRVYDVETNASLANFSVTCINRRVTTPITVRTDANGLYYIASIESGLTDCVATGTRYENRAKVVEVLKADNVTQDFDMSPLKGIINLSVIDSVSGLGIANALVSCVADYGLIVNTTTSASGNATLTALRIGTFTCSASAATYATRDTKVGPVIAGVPLNLQLVLSPNPGSITGRVYDIETGANLVGFNVICVSVRTSASVSNTTDALGNYFIGAIDVGNTSCTASGDRYYPKTVYTTVVRSSLSTADIPLLVMKGNIQVTVQDAAFNLRGIPDANVNCQTDSISSFTATSDTAGVVRQNNVTIGRYSCTATASGYTPNTVSGNVTLGNTLSLLVPLNPFPANITGTVVDSGDLSRVLTDATVSCVISGGVRTQVLNSTNPSGSFSYTGLTVFGNVVCSASRANFFTGSAAAVVLTRGTSVSVTIALNPTPMTVLVTVRDNVTNALLSGASVTCTNLAGVRSAVSLTNGQGVANFTLARGNYTCDSSLVAYFSGSSQVFGIEGETVTTTHRLRPLPGGLAITVLDVQYRTPISGATVTCVAADGSSGTNVTNANGVTNIINLDVNTYNCTASAPPTYLSNFTLATVIKNNVTSLTIFLSPRLITVIGNVTNVAFDSSTIVSGLSRVSVVIQDLSNPFGNGTNSTPILTGDGVTQDLGYFQFRSRIPVNVVIYLFDSQGNRYSSRVSSFQSSSTDDPITIPLSVVNLAERPPEIRGYIIDSRTGAPVVNATILFRLANASSDIPRNTLSGNDGFYSINTLGLGAWVVTASANEYIPATFPSNVLLEIQGDVKVANFTLVRLCCGNLVGEVRDSSIGQPLVNATVIVVNATDGTLLATNTTNSNGTYLFNQIPKGQVTIRVNVSGFTAGSLTTSVQPALGLQPQVQISVSVINVLLSGRIGIFTAANNSWSPLGGSYSSEIDVFLPGDANRTAVGSCVSPCVQFTRIPGTQTNWSIAVDWRRSYEIRCFDIPAVGAPGQTDYQVVIKPVPALGPGQGAVIDCPMVLKTKK